MGVFDRLGNLGKGMVKMWASPEDRPSRTELLDELDRLEDDARQAGARPQTGPAMSPTRDPLAADPTSRRRALLDQALQAGILTREEYDQKLAESTSAEGAPRKRRL
ncbi:MAG: hypothetical protein ACI9K2_001308 [Myxococcota bacterium]|jgi:hypothetical protein